MEFINDLRHREHYALAHQVIPELIEKMGSVLVAKLMNDGGDFLRESWLRRASQEGFDPLSSDDDFAVIGPQQDEELCLINLEGEGRAFLFLVMPQVAAPLESQIGTFVWGFPNEVIRYFTLEVEMSLDGAVGHGRVLCEWRNGNHLNYGGVQVDTLVQLRDAVRGILTG
jgi:hypothetical protein